METSILNNLQLIQSRVKPLEELIHLRAVWKFKDQKVVFTNGCFDIFHLGHLEYLSAAADLGARLVIGLNSDNSVRRQNKGTDRPINNEESRALVLAALSLTDAVVLFDTDTPEDLIRAIKPDVLVKGADWEGKEIAGADFVKSYGGVVQTISLTEGFSTTSIIQKIRDNG